jgi:hypothetical protein
LKPTISLAAWITVSISALSKLRTMKRPLEPGGVGGAVDGRVGVRSGAGAGGAVCGGATGGSAGGC